MSTQSPAPDATATPRTDNELRLFAEQNTEPAAQINYLTKLSKRLEKELTAERNLHGQARAAAYEQNEIANRHERELTAAKAEIARLHDEAGRAGRGAPDAKLERYRLEADNAQLRAEVERLKDYLDADQKIMLQLRARVAELDADNCRLINKVDVQAVELFKLEQDKARLDWLEALAMDGEDSRSIEVEKVQKSNRRNHFWTWPIFAISPVGALVIGLEVNRYSSEIRPGHNDEEYGGHWDVQCTEGATIRAAIDAARAGKGAT